MPAWLYDGLVQRHASTNLTEVRSKVWSFSEDHAILQWHLAGKPLAELQLAGRKATDISRQFRRLHRSVPFVRRAYQAAVITDCDAPYQALHYEQWSPIMSDCALPPDAHVDWLKGVAKVPLSWALHLNSTRFCFYDTELGARISVDADDVFTLEDVRADMTVGAITRHVARWLGLKGPGLALGVDAKHVRLAILSENVTPGDAEPAVTKYSRGQCVYHQCRDGVPRRATVTAVHDDGKQPRYTITVDQGVVRATVDELFSSFPPPPGPKREAAAPTVHSQLQVGSRVWYDSAHVSAPCRVRINGVDSEGDYSVTLEHEEHDVPRSQLLPARWQSSAQLPPSRSASQWAEAEISEILRDLTMTVRDADLFNRMARIVVVTDGDDGVDEYWEKW